MVLGLNDKKLEVPNRDFSRCGVSREKEICTVHYQNFFWCGFTFSLSCIRFSNHSVARHPGAGGGRHTFPSSFWSNCSNSWRVLSTFRDPRMSPMLRGISRAGKMKDSRENIVKKYNDNNNNNDDNLLKYNNNNILGKQQILGENYYFVRILMHLTRILIRCCRPQRLMARNTRRAGGGWERGNHPEMWNNTKHETRHKCRQHSNV